jgi:hypothetical protein
MKNVKTLAFALYAVSILLISGLARAATIEEVTQPQYQAPAQIHQVSAEGLDILIAGSLPNPCYGHPGVMLTRDGQNPDVLILHLSSPIPMGACVSLVKNFTAEVQLPLLTKASHLNIEPERTYMVKVEGSEFAMEVPGSDLLN